MPVSGTRSRASQLPRGRFDVRVDRRRLGDEGGAAWSAAARRALLLWGGFAVVTAILAGGLAYQRWDAKRDMLEAVRGYTLLLVENISGTFGAAEIASLGVLRAVSGGSAEHGTGNVSPAVLAEFMKSVPGAVNVFITDPGGRIRSAAVPVPAGATLGETDYFRALAGDPGRRMLITPSEKAKSGSEWVIRVLRRVEDVNGRFAGVVSISIGIDAHFSRFYRSAGYPPDTAITLWDRDTRLLMRYPVLQERVGSRSTSRVFDGVGLDGKQEAVDLGPSEFDGKVRARAVRRVPGYPLFAVVAVPQDSFLHGWDLALLQGIGAEAALLTVAVVLAVVFKRRQKLADEIEAQRIAHAAELQGFMEIVEAAQAAMALLDADMRCVVANSAMARLFKRKADSFRGEPAIELFPQDQRDKLKSAMLEALESGGTRILVEIPRDTDMAIFDMEVSPVGERGKGRSVVLSLRNVTAQRRTEATLAQSEAEWRAIFDAEPHCVVVLGPDGLIQKINPAGVLLIEADSLQHALGTSIESLVAAEDMPAFIDLHRRVLAGDAGQLRYRGTGLKGTRRLLDTRAVPLRDVVGRVIGALTITEEVGPEPARA